jgi:hypothetical protein
MRVYTFSEARRKLADLLTRASEEGEVRIRRQDGTEYVLRPRPRRGSPLDVPSVDTDVSAEEIVAAVRESRESARR